MLSNTTLSVEQRIKHEAIVARKTLRLRAWVEQNGSEELRKMLAEQLVNGDSLPSTNPQSWQWAAQLEHYSQTTCMFSHIYHRAPDKEATP